MPSPMMQSVLQSALLGSLANILAQVITSHGRNEPLSIDFIPVLQFMLFSIVSTPPNFLWQQFLESTFPAHPPPPHPKKSDEKPPPPPTLSVRNTAIKFILDQTIGATVNTLLFSIFMRSLQEAMHDAPRITDPRKAADYWIKGGVIDFVRVDFHAIWAAAVEEFWPIVFAGARLWPAVSLVNFSMVKTVQGRNLVGALAGVGWGVYMSMLAAN